MAPLSLLALLAALPFLSAQDDTQFTIPDPSASVSTAANEQARYLGNHTYSTRFPGVTWNNSAWTLTSINLQPNDYRAMPYAANGYFGQTFSSTGPFVQAFNATNGWPLFSMRQTFGTVANFFTRQNETEGTNFPWLYQYGYDSVISGIPAWSPLVLELASGGVLWANTSTDELSQVELVQDLRQGTASWEYTWTPEGEDDLEIQIKYTAFADKLNINNGYVRLEATPNQDVDVQVVSILDGANAVRTQFIESGIDGGLVFSGVSPNGVPDTTAWVYATLSGSEGVDVSSAQQVSDKPYIGDFESSIAHGLNTTLRANQTTSIVKHVGVASSDSFSNARDVARNAASSSAEGSFDDLLQTHAEEWESVLPKESVTDLILPWTGQLPESSILIEKQITTVSSAFKLLMNMVGPNAVEKSEGTEVNSHGLSVCGLTSDCYGGQRFWDQDVWMHPQLATSFPESARQVTNLRLAQYPQAIRNIERKNASTSQNMTEFSEGAALWPWTSGRDGNCTATGPCFDYQYHLNADIVRSFINEWASTGDIEQLRNEFFPIMRSVSTSYSDLLVFNDTTELYDMRNLTDPDEYANLVDNGGFTLAIVQNTLNDTNTFSQLLGGDRESQWDDQLSQVARPTEGDISLEYIGMNGSLTIKQADIVLNIYPVAETTEYPLNRQLADLDYYANKQSPDGPAMTWAIFSIAATAVYESGCSAFTYDETSWSPYIRGPWFSFSEQLVDDPEINGGTRPAYPFLTGHGGFLQVDTFGYLGLRRTPDYSFRIEPSLPPQIEYIRYPTVYHQGHPIAAWSNTTHTTLSRQSALPSLSSANQTMATSNITVVLGRLLRPEGETIYSLAPNSTLTIPNRIVSTIQTVPGNILQCRPATSPAETEPGLFPNGAVDGAGSTAWQPVTQDATSLTIDTSTTPFQPLTEARFDWGAQPPANFTLWAHNYTDPSTGTRVVVDEVQISERYDPVLANEVRPVVGNETVLDLSDEGVWSGNFVTLVVQGNLFNGSEGQPGATVREVSVVGERGA